MIKGRLVFGDIHFMDEQTPPKPKNKGGRPKGSGAIRLKPDQIELAAKLAGNGCNLNQIASIIGISPATLDKIIKENPDVSQAISKGRDQSLNEVMATAYQMAVSGKVPAMTIFFLKTRARWAEAKDVEATEGDDEKNDFKLSYKE